MELSREDIKKIASLARLSLGESEVDDLAKHINDLIEQFKMLQALDVSGVEPTAHTFKITNVFRDDVVLPSLPRELALANAPDARDGCFVVPQIIE